MKQDRECIYLPTLTVLDKYEKHVQYVPTISPGFGLLPILTLIALWNIQHAARLGW